MSEQLTLDDYAVRPVEAPRRRNIDVDLARIRSGIGGAIVDFCRARLGRTFHAGELREHVAMTCGANAPASADRILRALRADQVVAYRVVDRSKSLYLVEGVDAPTTEREH